MPRVAVIGAGLLKTKAETEGRLGGYDKRSPPCVDLLVEVAEFRLGSFEGGCR